MAKWIKVILWISGATILLLVALAVALPLLFDPNDHKEEIAKLVRDKTGRNLDIQGDVSLSVFPWLGVETGKISLANPPEFGDEAMAELDEASVRLRLLPLLSRQIEAGTVLIKGLQLNLISDARGQTNWSDLAKPKDEEESAQDSASTAGLAALSLQGFDVRDSSVRYRDNAAGIEYQLSNLNLQTGTIVPGKDIPVQISGTVEGTTLDQAANFDLEGSINLATDSGLIHLRNVTLASTGMATLNLKTPEAKFDTEAQTLAINKVELDGAYGDLEASLSAASIAADLRQDTVALSAFVLDSIDGRIEGDLAGSSITTQPAASGDIKVSAVNIVALFDKLNVPHGLGSDISLQNVSASGTFSASQGQVSASLADVSMDTGYKGLAGLLTAPTVELDTGKQTFSAPQLTLDTKHGRIEAAIAGSSIVEAPKFSGALKSNELELRKLLQELGTEIELEDETSLSSASLQTRFDVSADGASLTELSAQVDDMKINGSLSVSDFEKPVYRFDLDIDRLDLDRSGQPDEGPGQSDSSKQSDNEASAAVLIPVALLRDLDADGTLSIGSLRASGLKMSQVEVGLHSKEGTVTIDPLRSLLYEGKATGTIQVDARSEVPTLAYDQDFSSISVLPLLSDAEVSDKLSGKGSLSFNFKTKGAVREHITKNMNGTANLAIRDGAIRGLNIQDMLISARKLYLQTKGREQEVDADLNDETKFSELSASLEVADGVARNNDLNIKSPLFRITGQGSADLTQETIDYLLTVNVVETFKGQGGEELEDLKGVPIPVRVDGTFSEPQYRIDLAGLAEAKAKAKIDEKVEEEKQELKEKVQEKLEEKLGDKLKGLFN